MNHTIDQKPKRVGVFLVSSFFLVKVFNIMTFEHCLLVLLVALSRKSKDLPVLSRVTLRKRSHSEPCVTCS